MQLKYKFIIICVFINRPTVDLTEAEEKEHSSNVQLIIEYLCNFFTFHLDVGS